MNNSTDTSIEFSRSFNEYNTSGLESDDGDGDNECERNDPVTNVIKTVMENKLKSNGTLKSVQNVVEIINGLSSQIKLPTNKDVLKKEAVLRFHRKFLIFCKKCNELCNEKNWCGTCGIATKKTKNNFVVYIPIEEQIKATLDKHFDVIVDYMSRNKNENITDFDNGNLYKRARQKYPHSILLCLTLNADGAQVHNSQKKSVWPIQLYQNYLPPHLRFKCENILLVTIYFGREKPDFRKLLYPLCEELQTLGENTLSFYRSGQIFHCVPTVTCCTLDLPARKLLSGLKSYSGKMACTFCLHEGISVTDHLKKKYIRYVKLNSPPANRTHESIIRAVERLSTNTLKKKKTIDGIVEIPPMLLFDGFDLSAGFAVDYMHNVAIGIMGMLLEFWMGSHRLSKSSPFFKPMHPKARLLLDVRLLALKPFKKITRKPKSLQDRHFFKASEYRNLLLYYLPICLEGLLDYKLLKHFKLLSAAIYMLLRTKISSTELNEAHQMLVAFADEFEELYGREAVTMNIHLLRHYKESVINSGPLWATSLFGFESNIGVICKPAKNCPSNELEVMSYDYCLWRSNKQSMSEDTAILRGKWETVPDTIATILQENQIFPSKKNRFFIGDTVKINAQHFKSMKSKKTKSTDHFIEMKDNVIGSIQLFIEFENKIYLVLQEYNVIERYYHLSKIRPIENIRMYSIEDIVCKLLYMNFSDTHAVTKEPNNFEN